MVGKLNQVLAVEKGIKAKANEAITAAYHLLPKPALFNGFTKIFAPLQEGGEVFPPENVRVQTTVEDTLLTIQREMTDLMDVCLTKDLANCNAKADIIIEDPNGGAGRVIATGVPATHLLFLEKQLTDLKTHLSKVPVLDPSENWTWDKEAGLFKAESSKTARSKKVQKALVLVQPTDKHPAQAQLITEDETVGHWTQQKLSGAVPAAVRQEKVNRADALLRAVQKAREAANNVEAPNQRIGKSLLDFVLGG